MSEAGGHGRVFSPVTVALMIAAGVFAFAAFAVLSAYAPELRRGNDGGGHALSRSAVGFAGAVRLLEETGVPVTVSRAGRRAQTASLFIATPEPVGKGPARKAVDDFVDAHEQPIMLVLPKWSVEPDPRRPGWVRRAGPLPADAAASPAEILQGVDLRLTRRPGRAPAQLTGFNAVRPVLSIGPASPPVQQRVARPGLATLATAPVQDLQTITGTGFQTVLRDAAGGTVLAYAPQRNTYVLSDPDLLNTHGVGDPATARAGLAILNMMRADEGPVVFDVSLHGFGQGRSLLKLAFAPPFLAVTFCAAAAAALAGWQAAVRFGPNVRTGRAFALGKQALADNAAALIKLSGREPRMAGRYAELTQARAARAVGAPPGDEAATAGYLDALPRAAADSPRLRELQAQARAARSREQMLAAARGLHRWRREIAREQ